MKLYKNLARFYDLLYDYRDYQKEINFLLIQLPVKENIKILDICCGTGKHLEELRKKLPTANLNGIDLNKKMINEAKKRKIRADFQIADMRNYKIKDKVDLTYCYSSSIQYNLTEIDLLKTINNIIHKTKDLFIFDLNFCKERWKEGHTNITTGSNVNFQVAELYTSHSKNNIATWNPLYLIKENKTGKIEMHVDNHKIRIWSIKEVENILKKIGVSYRLHFGYDKKNITNGTPIFIVKCDSIRKN